MMLMPDANHKALVTLVTIFLLPLVAGAELPTPLSRFGNLPCLAPIIRAVDPDAPKNIGEALLLPPYRPLDTTGGTGVVTFPTTGANPEAQAAFEQGVAHLHGFADRAAERSFRRSASLNPEHPMPYWGLAMANERHPGRASVYARYALYLAGRFPDLSTREHAWITLCHAYFSPAPEQGDTDLRRTRVRALEDLAYAYPGDVEARAFLLRALVLDQYQAGIPAGSHFAVDAFAGTLLTDNPQHPAANYRPLLWLRERPKRAASFAFSAPGAAPESPGAWRIAAEALAAAGDYPSALDAQATALRLDLQNLRLDLAMPDEDPDFATAVAAHLESLIATGQTTAAAEIGRHLITLPRSVGAVTYRTGRRLLASALMRGERWAELREECTEKSGALLPTKAWPDRAHTLYWRAVAEWNLGQKDAAKTTGTELESLFRSFLSSGTTLDAEKEIVSAVKSLRAYASLFETPGSKVPTAPLLHISKSLLARTLVGKGDTTAALELAGEDLGERPGVPEAVATYCSVATAAGKMDTALPLFDTTFRQNASLADRQHPLFRTAQKPIIDRLKLRGNWTLTPPASKFPSKKPARWSPPPAPAFDLPRPDGGTTSLASLHGKPVLLIFFVGVGCPYCVEQLKIFRPHEAAFNAADIPILTISTDSPKTLSTTLNSSSETTSDTPTFPFPILADASLETFHTYKCFDSFNNKPLHGIYLVSPRGHILWQNISHEPFLYPEFLLEESRRLLSLWPDVSVLQKK